MRLITRLVAWASGLALGLVALLFAIETREPVTLSVWGIPDQITLPLFLAVLGAWVVGFFCGSVIMWFCDGKSRRLGRSYQAELHEARKEIERMNGELAALRQDADAADQARIQALGAANSNNQARLLPSRSA